MGGGKVRVQVDGALVFLRRIFGATYLEGREAKYEMRPRVTIVEFRRAGVPKLRKGSSGDDCR
jgi:hypothetical protein